MGKERTLSAVEWYMLGAQKDELGSELDRLRVELDTRAESAALQARFEDLAKEFHKINLLMAH